MDDRYSDLPTQGKHNAPDARHTSGQEVRAEGAQDRPGGSSAYVLHRHAGSGHRRISQVAGDAHDAPGASEEGYTEVGRFRSDEEAWQALQEESPEIRYIVFENTRTGEITYSPETGVSTGWSSQGRFDRVTVFGSEAEAAAYAERRRR